ncbi:hypothetical protein BC829DRAFT_413360 [Chytridium lagenaria]|nr:hypothetical protein BC829DRAFT_413360 [Chytridium lagenaria]
MDFMEDKSNDEDDVITAPTPSSSKTAKGKGIPKEVKAKGKDELASLRVSGTVEEYDKRKGLLCGLEDLDREGEEGQGEGKQEPIQAMEKLVCGKKRDSDTSGGTSDCLDLENFDGELPKKKSEQKTPINGKKPLESIGNYFKSKKDWKEADRSIKEREMSLKGAEMKLKEKKLEMEDWRLTTEMEKAKTDRDLMMALLAKLVPKE